MSKYDSVREAEREFESLQPARRFTPQALTTMYRAFRRWWRHLATTGTRRDQPSMSDWLAYERGEIAGGRSMKSVNEDKYAVVAYYDFLGDQLQNAAYSAMSKSLSDYTIEVKGALTVAWEQYPVDAGPKMLAAARSYAIAPTPTAYRLLRYPGTAKKWNMTGRRDATEASEDALVIMCGLYGPLGRSAAVYAIQVADIDFERHVVMMGAKGGYTGVPVPLHPVLEAAFRAHIATRDYTSAFLFRHGRAMTVSDKTGWKGAGNAAESNATMVGFACHRVSEAYRAIYGDAEYARIVQRDGKGREVGIVYHRFRDHMASWGDEFGLSEKDVRLLLSHGAKNITKHYTRADMDRTRRKISKLDFGSAEWVAANADRGSDVTKLADGNGVDIGKIVADAIAPLVAELVALRAERDALRAAMKGAK